MIQMLTPERLLPTINETGHLVPVQDIFANHRLTDEELHEMQDLGLYLQGLTASFGGGIGLARDEMPENQPWLDEWAKQMDAWVEKHGLLLPVPIEQDGSLEIIINVGQGTPDHVDTWKHMPVGLSIGLQGRRELVGVPFDEIDEAFEAQQKLKRDGTRLADVDDFEGKTVQRIVQETGDVTQIAGYATLHSGRPLEMRTRDGEELVNAVAIIGYMSMAATGHESIAEEHMSKYYRTAGPSLTNKLSGNSIVSSVY